MVVPHHTVPYTIDLVKLADFNYESMHTEARVGFLPFPQPKQSCQRKSQLSTLALHIVQDLNGPTHPSLIKIKLTVHIVNCAHN